MTAGAENLRFAAFGVSRHRLFRDGQGVTTLVGGYGCPLDCRFCLNPVCRDAERKPKRYTVEELFARVKIDDLYFEATGGGVTFGGGEPLLQSAFIRAFIRYAREAGKRWRFAAETSLAVDPEKLECLLPKNGETFIREWIVDVKDMDPAVYRAYTGISPERMRANLETLARFDPAAVTVRVPLIPGYNTEEDCDRSERELRKMGFSSIDRFRYITER